MFTSKPELGNLLRTRLHMRISYPISLSIHRRPNIVYVLTLCVRFLLAQNISLYSGTVYLCIQFFSTVRKEYSVYSVYRLYSQRQPSCHHAILPRLLARAKGYFFRRNDGTLQCSCNGGLPDPVGHEYFTVFCNILNGEIVLLLVRVNYRSYLFPYLLELPRNSYL